MNISFKGQQLELSPALKDQAESGILDLIDRFVTGAEKADISFRKEAETFYAHIKLHAGNFGHFEADGEGATAYIALDEVLNHLQTQVKKIKITSKTTKENKKHLNINKINSWILTKFQASCRNMPRSQSRVL